MFTPAKRLIMMGFRPKNEVQYNPTTWAEWLDKTGVVKAPDGITLSASGASTSTSTTISVKPNTQYGFLCTVTSSTISSNAFYLGGGGFRGAFVDTSMGKTVGNQKKTVVSRPEGNIFYVQNNGTATESITVKDIRVFELPTGSQIEADFTNLTADQLNAKYPF